MNKLLFVLIIVLSFSTLGCVNELKSSGQQIGKDVQTTGIETIKKVNESLYEPQEIVSSFCAMKNFNGGKIFKVTYAPTIVCYSNITKTTESYSYNEYMTYKEFVYK